VRLLNGDYKNQDRYSTSFIRAQYDLWLDLYLWTI